MTISKNSIINNEYLYPLKKIRISSVGNVDINTLLKVEMLQSLIEENKVFANKFGKSIKSIIGFSCKRTQLNKDLLNKLKKSHFFEDYQPYLTHNFNTKSSREAIKFLFLEYFILIDLFNVKLITEIEFKNYLTLSFDKEEFIKNSNLLITNKQAFELTSDTVSKFVSGKNKELKNQVVVLVQELGIPLLEIPQFYNLELLVQFLNEVKELKQKLNINKMSFKLRFKKLKHFKKDGMYIVNDKTIIVDPRKPKAFIHELGHYIYEEKINIALPKFVINNNNLYNKSKFESYSIESENFAYGLEKYLN